MKTCPDCLSNYKRSRKAKLERKAGGAWGRGLWPAEVYHNAVTRKCPAHHAQSLADTAVRRAAEIRAMPVWADRAAIRSVYAESVETTRRTGIPHDVDHIVPLRGKTVSGLHVHWNLRVIPSSVNRAKSNHFNGAAAIP